MALQLWELHGDGRTVTPGAVVRPEERLSWGRTAGIGMQHVVAMFGATFLVPVLTGFPPATTIFFSGVGTLLFLVITRNRIPSYLGSSFAFIAPVIAAKAEGGIPAALGGIVVCGVLFFLIGLVVDRTSSRLIEWLMPPVVTGAIVALIGLNLAPVARDSFARQPLIAFITLVAILVIGIVFKGFIGRLSVFLGVLVGYLVAAVASEIDFGPVGDADWVGLPDFNGPTFTWRAVALIAPVVIVLVAENTGHVKAVAAMTERNLDDDLGKAYMGDGAATALAGLGGGSGTTTYAENIGVMAATKVYSTAAYVIAGVTAILLGLVPKFGALIVTIPAGVLGGATTVLYGMIAVLGARIWIESRVDFRDNVNLVTAAVALIVGAANYTLTWGDLEFNGIALGSFGAIIIYQVLRALGGVTGSGATLGEGAIASPAGGVRGWPTRRRGGSPGPVTGRPGSRDGLPGRGPQGHLPRLGDPDAGVPAGRAAARGRGGRGRGRHPGQPGAAGPAGVRRRPGRARPERPGALRPGGRRRRRRPGHGAGRGAPGRGRPGWYGRWVGGRHRCRAAAVAAGRGPARPRPEPGRAVGAGPAPRLRDRRGPPGRAARVLLLRRARPGHRGRLQAGRGRARPAAHGPGLRHRHHRRGRPRVRQRRPPRPGRDRRRLRHRHPGGHLPARRGRGRHLPRRRGRRPRPLPRGRRHHDPPGPRPAGRRRRHRAPCGHLQTPRPGGRPPGRRRRRRDRQAGGPRLSRPERPATPPARGEVRGFPGGRGRLGARRHGDRGYGDPGHGGTSAFGAGPPGGGA